MVSLIPSEPVATKFGSTEVKLPGYSAAFAKIMAALSGGLVGDGYELKVAEGTNIALRKHQTIDGALIAIFTPKPTLRVQKKILMFNAKYDTTIEGIVATATTFWPLVDKAPDPLFEVTE